MEVKKLLLVLFLFHSCSHTAFADQKSFDCKMKQLALDFGKKIQPFLTKDKVQEIADALNGAPYASQQCNVSVNMPDDDGWKPPSFTIPRDPSSMIYVDANKGSDSNTGSMSSPFKSLAKAVEVSRSSSQVNTLVLRGGTYYLANTINLGSSDSGLTIMNYQKEEVWISGARLIMPKWTPVSTSNNMNIYMADLSSENFNEFPGLRINGERGIRARYPNANPEIGFGSTLSAKSWIKSNLPLTPDKKINPDQPLRSTGTEFSKYSIGIGGPCKNIVPPAGYWCSVNERGPSGVYTHRFPSGMVADKSVLPNQPYKNATGAVIQAWRPAHWFSLMFEVGSYDPNATQFMFSKGGFQGGEGADSCAEFYIENVMEELDYPNEWYYDAPTKKLYFFYNDTSGTPPPATTVFEVPQLRVLFNISGNQATPVKGVSFKGVNFKDSVYTYMDPHGMPSGGDWTLERTGALFFEGTENTLVDTCIFTRLDGNGIMVSGYNRNTTIQYSEFVWIGNSAIAQWGYTKGVDEIPGMGWDGTDGNQPRFSRILYNFAHELGIWQKQSSFYFQAQSCQNLLKGNIFFNGPRAGINFNDGFGGDSNMTENLLFNTCRESGDHGPFNSWDRQVYVTKVKNGTATVEKQFDYISSNCIIANYHSSMSIDNDDGSQYYETYNNVFVGAGGLKSDFGGHDNHHHDNIYVYVSRGYGDGTSQLKGHNDEFYNNDVIQTNDGDYGSGPCTGDGKLIVHNNRVYTPNGKVTECKMDLAQWQAQGNDPGTVASKWPSDDDLTAMIKKKLQL